MTTGTMTASADVEITHENPNLYLIEVKHHATVRAMVRYKSMLDATLSEITTIKHFIKLKQDLKPHSCPPYPVDPKQRDL